MDLSSGWRSRFADAVGRPSAVQALTATAWRVVVDGRPVVAKVGPGIEDEAVGLLRLARVPGGPPVPEVIHVDADLLVTTWVDQGRRSRVAEEELGSVHGGHPEEDLAMLALFGGVPRRLVDAYGEVGVLGEGWEERVEFFQLYPVLVHAVLFGGAYRARAEAIARHFA
jgi:hypothetical protein